MSFQHRQVSDKETVDRRPVALESMMRQVLGKAEEIEIKGN